MGYLALYRKYRPINFDEISGQKEIVKVIKNSIENNKISHAYLFSGPRGTGKTTTAKIISKMVNCEHLNNGKLCGKCDSCLSIENNDIIEIDAASNNGVDEIREIRDKINLVPSRCKYKIYIIDEVHMLTTQAFNALLKTLEEPPSHIIFILATTEYYKIPLTILSRCQKFQFNKLSIKEMVDRLDFIAKKENVNVSISALNEIAKIADGGMRDAINLLDQLISYKNSDIELEDVYKICEIVSVKEIVELLKYLNAGENKKIIEMVNEINDKGYNLNKFLEEIIYFLRDVLVFKYNSNQNNINSKIEYIKEIDKIFVEKEIGNLIIKINDILNNIKSTNYPAIILVVELLKISNKKTKRLEDEIKNISSINSINDVQNLETSTLINNQDNRENNVLSENSILIRINNSFATANKEQLCIIKEKWEKVSDYLIDDEYGTIAGILNDTIPVVAGNEYIILSSKFDSIVQRINEQYFLIERLLKKIYNKNFKIVILTENKWNEEKNKYINSIKNGRLYTLITEEVKNEKEHANVEELINIIGEDIIEYN